MILLRYLAAMTWCALWVTPLSAQHNVSDTTDLFYTGDRGEQEFNLNEVRVRKPCACTGVCCCAKKPVDAYSANRFMATDQLLARDPKIDLIRRGAYALEPVLNGMSSDRINITIDGMKVFGACTDKMDPVTSYVEPNNMKSIAILQGTAGSVYGSSLGGSLNMETQGATIREGELWKGEIGAGYQSATHGLSSLYGINYSKGKFALLNNGVYRKFGNFRSGGGERISYTQFEKWNTSLSAKYMPDMQRIIRLDYIMDEGYNIGYAALPMDVLYAKAKIAGLSYEHYFKEGHLHKMEWKVYANRVHHKMDDSQRPEVPMRMDMPGSTETMGAFGDFSLKFKSHHTRIRLDGYQSRAYAEMTMFPERGESMFMLTWPDVMKRTVGMYANDEFMLGKGRKLAFNLRFDYLNTRSLDEFGIAQATVFSQDIRSINHRFLKNAGLSYSAQAGASFKYWVTAGYVERAPGTTEQYAFYIFNAFDGFDYLGKVDVRNERAWQTDVGLDVRLKRLIWNCSLFYYSIRDYMMGVIDPELDAMTIGARGVKVSSNIAGATLGGVRSGISYRLNSRLEVYNNASYTHGSTWYRLPLPMITPFRSVLGGRYTYPRGFVQLETESSAAQNRISVDFGEQSTPGFMLLHLRGGYVLKFGERQFICNAGIENVLDRKYRTHLTWGGVPQPGINAYVNLNYSF